MKHKPTASPDSFHSGKSSLLAELAGEATSKLRAIQSETLDQQAKIQRLDAALQNIFKFFHSFSGHVNNIAPIVPRSYNFDTKTTFSALKWQDAFTDYRKQDLSDKALTDHVSFRVRLTATEPVIVTRRWNQFETLKMELDKLGLSALDDLDLLLRNKSQQEMFSARLVPDFSVKILFHGNYDAGLIDMQCKNLDCFSTASIQLKPESVTSELLDDIGRFLIGRTHSLPLPLIEARQMPKQVEKQL